MKRAALLFGLVCLALVLPACGMLAPPSPTPTETPRPTPVTVIPAVPTLDLTGQPGVSDATAAAGPNQGAVPTGVEMPAADGLVLRGLFYPGPEKAAGVLLLHMLGGNKEDWGSLAAALQAAGLAVLAMDMRGHGASGGEPDWTAAQDDVRAMLDFLRAQPNVDPERVALVGASIGANLALTGCADHEACRTVVLLSPGLDYHGVTTEDEMPRLGERPVLLVASEDDSYSAQTARTLDGLAQGEHELEMYESAGHGTAMFNVEPGLHDLIVDWLRERLQ
jgi:pimeloyl-ACP methyl ester carboxylesterase